MAYSYVTDNRNGPPWTQKIRQLVCPDHPHAMTCPIAPLCAEISTSVANRMLELRAGQWAGAKTRYQQVCPLCKCGHISTLHIFECEMQNTKSCSNLFTQAQNVLMSIREWYDACDDIIPQYTVKAVILGWTPSTLVSKDGRQRLIDLDSCTQQTWDQIAKLYTDTVKFCDKYAQKVLNKLQSEELRQSQEYNRYDDPPFKVQHIHV